jgi:hypothetical protein
VVLWLPEGSLARVPLGLKCSAGAHSGYKLVATTYVSKWLTYYLVYFNCLKADILILLGC